MNTNEDWAKGFRKSPETPNEAFHYIPLGTPENPNCEVCMYSVGMGVVLPTRALTLDDLVIIRSVIDGMILKMRSRDEK